MQTDREMLLAELLATMADRGEQDRTPSEDELSLRLDELSDDELQQLYSMGRFVRTLDTVGAFAFADKEAIATTSSELPTRIGKYTDLEIVGIGGFANVYRAFDSELKRVVALKILHSHRVSSFESRERFRREAQAVAGLSHDAVVSLHEANFSDEQALIALEWVDGPNLQKWLKGNRQNVDAMSSAKAIRRLADALSAAHNHGVLHRDVKPANVLVPAQGNWFEKLKLTDFGLTRGIQNEDSVQLTGEESILGTPSYMSPEQARSDDEVGPASDIYSLGAVLYELLAGVPPHKKDNFAKTLLAVENEPAKNVRARCPDVPRDLAAICMKMLEYDPAARYTSAMELSEDLGRFMEAKPVKARPVGVPGRIKRWTRRNTTLAVLGSIVLFSLLTVIATTSWFSSLLAGEQQQLQEARNAEEVQRELKEQSLQSVEKALQLANPVRGREEQLTAVTLLRATKSDIVGKFHDEPEVRAQLLSKIAQGFVAASMHSDAVECREEALAILDDNFGPLDSKSMNQLRLLAQAQMLAGQLKESLENNRELLLRTQNAVEKNEKLGEKAKQSLAKVQLELGRYEEVIRSLSFAGDELGNFSEQNRNLILIKALRESGLVDEALVLAKAFWQFHEKQNGRSSFVACRAKAEYIVVLTHARKRKKAIRLANQLVADWSATNGLSSKYGMKWSILNGWLHFDVRDLDEAEAIADRAIEAGEDRYGESHSEIIRLKMLKSRCHAMRGDRELAIAILAEAISDRRKESGVPGEHELELVRDLSRQCRHNGQPERSLDFLQTYLPTIAQVDPLEHESIIWLRKEYFRTLAANGRPGEAVELCQTHVSAIEKRSQKAYAYARLYLVHLLIHADRIDDALKESTSLCVETGEAFQGRFRAKANCQLVHLLMHKGDFEHAHQLANESREGKVLQNSYGNLLDAMAAISGAFLLAESDSEVESKLRDAKTSVGELVESFPNSELHIRVLILRTVAQQQLLEKKFGMNEAAIETGALVNRLRKNLYAELEH